MRDVFKNLSKWLFQAVVIAIIISVFGEFFIEYAREKGAYDNPSDKVDTVITQTKGIGLNIAEFVTSGAFRIGIGAVAVFALGIAICYLAIKYEDKKRLKPKDRRLGHNAGIVAHNLSQLVEFPNQHNSNRHAIISQAYVLMEELEEKGYPKLDTAKMPEDNEDKVQMLIKYLSLIDQYIKIGKPDRAKEVISATFPTID